MQPWHKQIAVLVVSLLVVSLLMSLLQFVVQQLGLARAALVLTAVALVCTIVWKKRQFFLYDVALQGGSSSSRMWQILPRVLLVSYMLAWVVFLWQASSGADHSPFLLLLFLGGLVLYIAYGIQRLPTDQGKRTQRKNAQRPPNFDLNGWQQAQEGDETATPQTITTFADVAGCPEAITELREVVEYLRTPDQFKRFGARLPKGVLLVGDPGTGKTLLARAVAGEAGAKFIACAGSDFVEMYVGVGASRIREKFREARSADGSAIVFIDEIDAVGKKRASGVTGGHQEWDQTLNALLVEMDGFPNDGKVIVIAATNRLDVLDPALTRPGRFDRHVHVPLPDLTGREQIFKVHMRGKPLAKDIDFKQLAERTFGFSGAEIAAACNEAAFVSARRHIELERARHSSDQHAAPAEQATSSISVVDLDEGIERAKYGAARTSVKLTDWDRLNTAVHEVCHGLITSLFKGGDPVQKLTILPRQKFLGFMQSAPVDNRVSATREYLLVRIITLMAGRAGQEVLLGTVDSGASQDFEMASELAGKLVMEYGMSELGPISIAGHRQPGAGLANAIDAAIGKIQCGAMAMARQIVSEQKAFILAATSALLKAETVLAPQWHELLKHHQLEAHAKTVVFEALPLLKGGDPDFLEQCREFVTTGNDLAGSPVAPKGPAADGLLFSGAPALPQTAEKEPT